MTEDHYEAKADVRIDAWLWAARFFKSRSLARQAVEGGKVHLGGVACKPARPVRVGDTLAITRGEERYIVQVLGLARKRGTAPAAQALYCESEESRVARETLREQRRVSGEHMNHPAGRPGKQDRRALRRFKQDAVEDPD